MHPAGCKESSNARLEGKHVGDQKARPEPAGRLFGFPLFAGAASEQRCEFLNGERSAIMLKYDVLGPRF